MPRDPPRQGADVELLAGRSEVTKSSELIFMVLLVLPPTPDWLLLYKVLPARASPYVSFFSHGRSLARASGFILIDTSSPLLSLHPVYAALLAVPSKYQLLRTARQGPPGHQVSRTRPASPSDVRLRQHRA